MGCIPHVSLYVRGPSISAGEVFSTGQGVFTFEVFNDDITMGHESTQEVSLLEFGHLPNCFLQVALLLLLKVLDGVLNGVLGFLEVLVLADGSGEVIRKVRIKYLVNGVGTGGLAEHRGRPSCSGVMEGMK